jgi:hypothetical protein
VSLLGAAPLRMYLHSFLTEVPIGPNARDRAARIAEIEAELSALEAAPAQSV